MDDSSFDEFIKRKLEDQDEPSFDPGALSDLHNRLESFNPLLWYVKYRTEIFVVTALIAFTLFNSYPGLFTIKTNEKSNLILDDRTTYLRNIDSLTAIIHNLTNNQNTAVYIVDPSQHPTLHANQLASVSSKPIKQTNTTLGHSKFLLGQTSDVEPSILVLLKKKDMITIENGNVYLVIKEPDQEHNQEKLREYSFVPIFYSKNKYPELKPVNVAHQPVSLKNSHHQAISAKTKSDLEKHYFQGLGINVAPHVDLMTGVFSRGEGSVTPRIGVSADWIISPRLSVETSLDYANTKFTFDKDDIQSNPLPFDKQPGSVFEKAEVLTKTISSPLGLKYRQWISDKSQAFIKVGYTPYFSFNKQYVFGCSFKNTQDTDYDNHDDKYTFNKIERRNEVRFYTGTFTSSVGITKTIPKNKKVELSLFYEKSMGLTNPEKLGMQLLGFKTAYWFKVK